MSDGARRIGRYAVHGEIAAGGMATVHLGRLVGPAGFARTVAVKRLHAQFASDPDFVAMFMDEAWLAARIQHPNVVQTLDVVSTNGELLLVMDYVQGETLSKLLRALREKNAVPPVRVVASIVAGVLHGLHAAHEAKDERGVPLEIVHRDVSPQNVIVGVDGVARVLDFGVAKAAVRMQTTREGQLKGKIAYMAPEQLMSHSVTRRSDVYAVGVVLWEALTAKRLFEADTEGQLVHRVVNMEVPPPSVLVPGLPEALDRLTMTALARDPSARFASARDMALALEATGNVALPSEVGRWVEDVASVVLAKRIERVQEVESLTEDGRDRARLQAAAEATRVRSAADVPVPPGSSPSGTSAPSIPSSPSSTSRAYPSIPSSPSTPSFVSRTQVPSSVTSASRIRAADGKKRIVVIDDSEVVLAKTKRVLEMDGYDVTTTSRTVGNAKYVPTSDLIIIDFHMPGIDGGGVIASLRAAATAAHPCLFYLYTADPAVAKDYARLGFDGAFTDKGDEASLLRQVKSVFRMMQVRSLSKK
ncbi:MAG: protein kinase [Polyangiaceae bacterium]